MRLLHTSDWHLGRRLHGADLTAASTNFLCWLERTVTEENIDVVVISGDIYDRATPGEEQIRLLDSTLNRLTKRAVVVMISGNHDSLVRFGFGSQLWGKCLQVLADINNPQIAEIKDASGNVALAIAGVPYLNPDTARHILAAPMSNKTSNTGDNGELEENGADSDNAQLDSENTEAELLPRSHSAVLGAALDNVAAALAKAQEKRGYPVPEILLGHAFVTGASVSDSERDISVGGVGDVPASLFNLSLGAAGVPGGRLDYVALGHLHGAQTVSSRSEKAPLIRYSGSPLKFSFSEEKQQKSITVLDFPAPIVLDPANLATNDKEQKPAFPPQLKVIPCPVERELITLTGELNELLDPQLVKKYALYFVRAIITDTHLDRPRTRLAQHYKYLLTYETPNLVKQLLQNAVAKPKETTKTARKTPGQLAGDFFSSLRGRNLTEQETQIITAVYEQARKENL